MGLDTLALLHTFDVLYRTITHRTTCQSHAHNCLIRSFSRLSECTTMAQQSPGSSSCMMRLVAVPESSKRRRLYSLSSDTTLAQLPQLLMTQYRQFLPVPHEGSSVSSASDGPFPCLLWEFTQLERGSEWNAAADSCQLGLQLCSSSECVAEL